MIENLRRLSLPDRIRGGSAVVGLLTSYLTWSSYDVGGSHISNNGLRASLLGTLFFLLVAGSLLLLADQIRWLRLPWRMDHGGLQRICAVAALTVVILQGLFSLMGGQSLHKGYGLALVAAVGLSIASRLDRSRSRSLLEG